MSENTIGWITVRIPVIATTESESWEMPQEYTYLSAGTATVVDHNIPDSWWENLGSELTESGLSLEELSDTVLSATMESEPKLAPTPTPEGNRSELIRALEADAPDTDTEVQTVRRTDEVAAQNAYFDGAVTAGEEHSWSGEPFTATRAVEPADDDDVDVQAAARIAEAADQNAYFDGAVTAGEERRWRGSVEPLVDESVVEPALDEDEDELFDDDGYPTDAALRKLARFRGTPADLIEYVKSLWWQDLYTVKETLNQYGTPFTRVSLFTGGWSGNESVVGALHNSMFHFLFWSKSERGGLTVFEVQSTLMHEPSFYGQLDQMPKPGV